MSGIELHVRAFPGAFLQYVTNASAALDAGPAFPIRWGVNPMFVPPGRHQIRVSYAYLWFKRCNPAEIVVEVPAGGLVRVVYRARWLVFLKGKLAVEGVVAEMAPVPLAASWQPDPSGRFELRYWDGAAWTAHVANGGIVASDPVPGEIRDA